ncbi:MAG: hypothetical protein RSE41_00075 [Clostridia bacterium]
MKTDILVFFRYIHDNKLSSDAIYLKNIEIPFDYKITDNNVHDFILSLTDKLNDKEELSIIEICKM